jgi:YHS domain-containing protein
MNATRRFVGLMKQLLVVMALVAALIASAPARAQSPQANAKLQQAPDDPKAKNTPTDPNAESTGQVASPESKSKAKAEIEGQEAKQVDKQSPGREPALKGYCPAAYMLEGKAVKGDPEIRSTYTGELYYFSNAEAKKKFDADPEKYLPRFGGLCTTALGGPYQNRLPCDPEVFEVLHDKLYLFSCERAKRAFDTKPQWFISGAKNAFGKPALGGFSPVAYQTRNKAIMGHKSVMTLYRGNVYWFPTASERDTFLENPEKYLPKYDGYCAEGVGRDKRYPADPQTFAVHDGRTYLFYDPKAKVTFLVNPMESARKADANWVTLKDKPRLP